MSNFFTQSLFVLILLLLQYVGFQYKLQYHMVSVTWLSPKSNVNNHQNDNCHLIKVEIEIDNSEKKDVDVMCPL